MTLKVSFWCKWLRLRNEFCHIFFFCSFWFLLVRLVENSFSCSVVLPPFSCFVGSSSREKNNQQKRNGAVLLWHCCMAYLYTLERERKKRFMNNQAFYQVIFHTRISFLYLEPKKLPAANINKKPLFRNGRHMKSFSGPHFRVPEPVDCISFKCIPNKCISNGQGFSEFQSSELRVRVGVRAKLTFQRRKYT